MSLLSPEEVESVSVLKDAQLLLCMVIKALTEQF